MKGGERDGITTIEQNVLCTLHGADGSIFIFQVVAKT